MTVNEFIKQLQSVPSKQRELPMIFRTAEGKSLGATKMVFGIKEGDQIAVPSIGETPNCIVVQITTSVDSADTKPESTE